MKHLRLPLLGAALLAAGLTGCQSSQATNHWHIDWVSTSVKHAFFGTVPDDWSDFKEQTAAGSGAFGTTLRRHFLNDNPDNPLQPEGRSKPSSPPPLPDDEFEVGG